jgi:proteasome accessory factor B
MDDERVYTFAVDRILSVESRRERFEYPSPRGFDPVRHFADTFGIFVPPRKERKRTEVELVFANERWLKLYVRERRWHPTQEFKDLRDGRLHMKFRVDNLIEVLPWIRSFGGQVTVLKPKEIDRSAP